VGIDVGLHHFAATSDGDTIDNPRFFRKEEKALKKAQRKVERLSRARTEQQKAKLRKAKNALARVNERIANKRHDFLHQQARKLVNRYGLIAIEDLHVDNLLARPQPKLDSDPGQYLPNGASQKAGLNKSIADAGRAYSVLS
jgi:putative transposase